MSLIVNNVEIDDVILNNEEIDIVEVNNITIWERIKEILLPLGTGTTFDMKVLYPDVDYTKLSLDSFIITGLQSSNSSVSATHGRYPSAGEGSATGSVTRYVSYNNSTGILTAYGTLAITSYVSGANYRGNNSTTIQATPYFVPYTLGEKYKKCGTGTSFNIRTLFPDVDYTTLTADNFICDGLSEDIGSISCTSYHASNSSITGVGWAWIGKTKSYDPSTGVLTAYSTQYTKAESRDSYNGGGPTNSTIISCTPYLYIG